MEIIKDFECRAMQSGSEDPEVSVTLQKCEEYIPGDVDIKALAQLCMEDRFHLFIQGNGISCKIQHFKLWRKVLKERYPEAIIGKQRRNSISNLKQNFDKDVRGIRFIIRFKSE